MVYISEDYCSEELSGMLMERGYVGATSTYLGEDDINVKQITIQSAMKWLREVYVIDITVDPHEVGNNWIYQFHICQNKDYLFSRDIDTSYENCAEAAIKYCLKSLV